MKRGRSLEKAQVTIFVIIVLIFLGFIIIFFAFKGNLKIPGINNVASEVREIDSVIESCFEQRAIDAIRLAGLQGGYINLPEDYLTTDISNVVYGVKKGKRVLASKNKIEKEIVSYVEVTMPFCIDNDEFSEFQMTQREAEVNVRIENDYVYFSAKMPVSAQKGEETFVIEREYETEVPIRLGQIYDVASEIVDKTVREPEYIDVSYLGRTDFYIIFTPISENNLIYSITDSDSNVDGTEYTFVFAVQL